MISCTQMLQYRNNFREEGIFQIGHGDGNRVRLVGPQAGGVEVPSVAKFAGGGGHPEGQIFSDARTTVEDVGYGSKRHARELRDVADCRLITNPSIHEPIRGWRGVNHGPVAGDTSRRASPLASSPMKRFMALEAIKA